MLGIYEFYAVRLLKLLKLLLLLLLIFVHPYDPRCALFHYIKFVICTIFWNLIFLFLYVLNTPLLPICIEIVLWISFIEFVLETSLQAFTEMIINRVSTERMDWFSLVKNFTNKDSIHPDASLSSEIHYAWIRIASFEEYMFIIFVNKIYFYWIHPFVYTF